MERKCDEEEVRYASTKERSKKWGGVNEWRITVRKKKGERKGMREKGEIGQKRKVDSSQSKDTAVSISKTWLHSVCHFQTLTQHSAYLVGEHRVSVVQPAPSGQALLEATGDGLVAEQHHQDPEGSGHAAGVQVLLHEHQQPVEAQRAHQLIASPAGADRSASKVTLKGGGVYSEAQTVKA